ncbi:MAG: hypothetical protein RIG68_00855 [Imperialibacter sp.]|uniref:hypothetical protein n=1 Tax=Imperialibacter sp. TaxID=2038411 RepID=UPI0032EB2F08
MEKAILISHASAGALVLLTGLLNFISKKGGNLHKKLGIAYVLGMAWIFVSAILIIAFYRFSAFLMVVGVVSFYATFTGYRVTKRKKLGEHTWVDLSASGLTMAFGIGLVGYGFYVGSVAGFGVSLAILSYIFGFFTAFAAYRDLAFLLKPKEETYKLWWLRQHISAIGGSYIAAITAFAVQNGDRIMGGSQYQWLLWLIPTVIFTPAIIFFQRKFKTRKEHITVSAGA